jgi:non-heme chloroperoxidase
MMRLLIGLVLMSVAGLSSLQPEPWRDSSAHQTRLVTVSQGVQLELLDWGGTGKAVVLLAGSGNTAHSFDDFAPKLTDCCHVYGITRRGYGQSSRPSDGYADQPLADDVLRVLEREEIDSPVLIGHSMGGGEMTTLGRQHSDRIAGLVYIDALGDLEDDPPADPQWAAAQRHLPPGFNPPPTCPPIDRTSFAAFRRTLGCTMGFMFPEAELRNGFDNMNGSVGPFTTPDWIGRAIGQGQVFRRDYSNIRVPVLALLNAFSPEATTADLLAATKYTPKNTTERAALDAFVDRGRIAVRRWTDKLTRQVPDAHILYFPLAGHYLHMTREAEVVREIHAFMARLGAARRGP